MTGPLLQALAVSEGLEPPVEPGRDEARRWAAEELAKGKYSQARPSWLDQLWRDFLDWLDSLGGDGPSGGLAVPLIISLAVALIVVAIFLVRPRLNAHRKGSPAGMYGEDAVVGAAVYRQRARAAADDGDWASAVVDQFRALVRAAEERDVLEPRAGRTADEAADHLARVFAAAEHRLANAAHTFDAVLYGDQRAQAADFEAVRRLDADLLAIAPAYDQPAGHGLAAPR